MISVNTNPGLGTALTSLRSAQEKQNATMRRIATGLRVAGALDDASTFSIAQSVRGDLAAWSAVSGGLGRAKGIVGVGLAGAERVSNILGELRSKVIEFAAAADDSQKSIVQNHANALLAELNSVVQNSEFQGINVIAAGPPSTPSPVPPQPPGFGSIPTNGVGDGINTHAAPATPGTISLEIEAQGVPDAFEIIYDGNVVASTGGPITGRAVLSFDYPAGAVQEFQVRVTGGSGWSYTPYFNYEPPATPPPEAPPEPAFSVVTNPDGATYTVEQRGLTVDGLGLSGLTLDPPGSTLAQLNRASNMVSEAFGYFGSVQKTLSAFEESAATTVDSTTAGLGTMVDADMAAESAAHYANQVRLQLANQTLAIANASPRILLQLFP